MENIDGKDSLQISGYLLENDCFQVGRIAQQQSTLGCFCEDPSLVPRIHMLLSLTPIPRSDSLTSTGLAPGAHAHARTHTQTKYTDSCRRMVSLMTEIYFRDYPDVNVFCLIAKGEIAGHLVAVFYLDETDK